MSKAMLVAVFVLAVVFSFGTAFAGSRTSAGPPEWAVSPVSAGPPEWASPSESAGSPNIQAVGGEWSTPDDFTTKFWLEKFFGGGPGQEGNVLMAIGQGFVFQNAVLTGNPTPGSADGWCSDIKGVVTYTTVYENGRLTLNPTGPWLTKGTLIDRDVKAVNISCHKADGALLGFRLQIGFDPDDEAFEQFAEHPYTVVAGFETGFADGQPTNYRMCVDEDGVTVQKGYYFDATIRISPAP